MNYLKCSNNFAADCIRFGTVIPENMHEWTTYTERQVL